MLQRFAEKRGLALGEQIHMISLGQGQGPIAEMLMVQAARAGHWVCLQNCHLASSWMLRMEEKVEELGRESNANVHPDFRLWLTSMPSQVFPVPVLQNGKRGGRGDAQLMKGCASFFVLPLPRREGKRCLSLLLLMLLPLPHPLPSISPPLNAPPLLPSAPPPSRAAIKLTNEPPKGVKANVNRSYNDMTAEHLASCGAKPEVWRKLLFSLSFFHAVVQVWGVWKGGCVGVGRFGLYVKGGFAGVECERCGVCGQGGSACVEIQLAPDCSHTHIPSRSGASSAPSAGTSATSSTPRTWSAP